MTYSNQQKYPEEYASRSLLHWSPKYSAAFLCIILLCLMDFHCIVVVQAETLPPDFLAKEKQEMVATVQLYGMKNQSVLQALRNIPRHLFVPREYRELSYQDSPLPIGYGQTISQPFIVAEMTRLLHLSSQSKVLEIGTGSGYQAAILSEFTDSVFSIEIVAPLYEQARKNLTKAGIEQVQLKLGDGYYGWPEEAPFTSIIVTCAAGQIPPPLIEQLAPGGKMIIPVGTRFGTQFLILVEKHKDGTITSRNLMPVSFVPLVRQ